MKSTSVNQDMFSISFCSLYEEGVTTLHTVFSTSCINIADADYKEYVA